MDWDEANTSGGVTERPFRLAAPSGGVPGILWLPADAPSRRPLILLGHGGGSHKRSPRMIDRAAWFAAHAGLAAVAIDGPCHGDRRTTPTAFAEYQTRIEAEGIESILDQMAADWLATVDALAGVADTNALGYLGMSMGTRFGLPTTAALGDRLRVAVLGKFGLRAVPGPLDALSAPDRLAEDARQITTPTLFHIQWDDEIFTRESQLALFDLLGAPKKELIAYPGNHAITPPEATHRWRDFVLRHLPT